MITMKTGVSIAASAALLALTATATPSFAAAHAAKTVHCYGVNSCKGTSDCKTATSSCKGQNECKGHGFKEMTAKKCTAAHGSLTAPAA